MSYCCRSPVPRARWRAGGALVPGYRAAGTLSGRTAFPIDDPMRIPRILVGDWDGDRFARQLRKYSMFSVTPSHFWHKA